LNKALEVGLDLVEVAPTGDPPVCRIMDYGKFKYLASKKDQETRKKGRASQLKEIKLRPLTQEHDVGVKIKNIRRFLESGDKVKVHVVFRGRERSHSELGFHLLEDIIKKIEDIGVVEALPKMEGRDMSMLVVPR